MPDKKSIYWLSRAMADEARAQRIADGASEEIRQMYRRQYLKVVQQIKNLKAELDAGRELTRTQLWNYSRWSQLEEELKSFVTESTRFNINETEKALNEVFEKTIGATAESFSRSRMTLPISANDVINTAWSGERYSARIWKNQAAIADRLKNSMEDMLVQGRGLPDIKKQIMKEFNVAYNDADRLVRTEAAYVLNRANVAKYRQAGLKKVEWSVGPEDGRECAVCAARGGKVYLIDEAPIIPAHPRCRCIYAGVVELSNEDVEVDGPATDAALEAAKQQKKLQKAADDRIESKTIEMKAKTWYNKNIAGNSELEQEYEKALEAAKEESGIRGTLKAPEFPKEIERYGFDDKHINLERGHNVTKEQAERYIQNAVVKIERKNGVYINYYSLYGAAYTMPSKKLIRTAVNAEEYKPDVKKMLEVIMYAIGKSIFEGEMSGHE